MEHPPVDIFGPPDGLFFDPPGGFPGDKTLDIRVLNDHNQRVRRVRYLAVAVGFHRFHRYCPYHRRIKTVQPISMYHSNFHLC